jgi:hypothetical protein
MCNLSGSSTPFHITSQTQRCPENCYWTLNVRFSSKISVWDISHSKRNSARHYHKCTYVCIVVKYLDFLVTFSKNSQLSNFTKMRPMGVELFHADGRTDMRKLIEDFSSFPNAPKIITQYTPCTPK